MAWCENPECSKTGLRKEDVEFDEIRRQVLCRDCFCAVNPDVIFDPPRALIRPPGLQYELHLTSYSGLTAKVGQGDVSIGLNIPMDSLKKFFDVETR